MRFLSLPSTDWQLAATELARVPEGQSCRINNEFFIKMPQEILWCAAKIGEGTYTAVYLAINQREEKFALKFSSLDPSVENEVRIEENLGLLIDSCVRGDQIIRKVPYLGVSLDSYTLNTHRIFTADEVLKLVIDCLQAVLDFSYGYHPAGSPSLANCRIDRYLHRDIKPQNLVVDPETMRVSAVDFGYAKETDPVNGWVLSQHIPGTLAYVAPELFRAQGPFVFSRSTDTYALGITFRKILHERIFIRRESDKRRCAPILGLSMLMSAERPELRPSLESIKLTILVWSSLGLSREDFARYLVAGFSVITDTEEAFARAVILLNANEANRFSEQKHFNRLMCNNVLREIISALFARRQELAGFISEFLKPNPVSRLSKEGLICQAYLRLKRSDLADLANTRRLFHERAFCETLARPDISDEAVRDFTLRLTN